MKAIPAKLLLLFALCTPGLSWAGAAVTYHGRIVDPQGQPINSGSVSFKIQVRSPGATSCLLYEETRVVNMAESDGVFVIPIGDGQATRSGNDPGLTIESVFSNNSAINHTGLTCNSGSAYQPTVLDARSLSVSFNDGTGSGDQLLPAMDVNYVPFSMHAAEAEKALNVGAVPASRVMSVASGAATPISAANFSELLLLLNGTSSAYVKTSSVPTCAGGEVLKGTGGAFVCVTDSSGADTLAGISCADGKILKRASGVWACGDDSGIVAETDPSVAAYAKNAPGAGLKVTSNLIVPDFGTGAGKVVEGNDSRLTDNRVASDINGVVSTGIIQRTGAGTFTALGTTAPINVTAGNIGLALGAGLTTSSNQLVPDFGSASGKVAQGNDSRFPSGTCGAGNYMRWTGSAWSCDVDNATDSTKVLKSGDTMTGTLNLPANGLVAGTNQLVLSGGNLGIGTTNPSSKLHLENAGAVAITLNDSSNTQIPTINFQQNGSTKAAIEAGVALANRIDLTVGGVRALTVGGGNGSGVSIGSSYAGAVAPAGGLIVKGNVGIGIASAAGPLSVNPPQYSTGTASQSGTTVTGVGTTWTAGMVGSQLSFANGASGGVVTGFGGTTSLTVSTSQTVSAQGYTINYTGLNVAGSGNVGIGTTAPVAKLDVAGEVKFGNTSSTCDGTNEGQQRYNSTAKAMEFCNGSAWTAMSSASSSGGFSHLVVLSTSGSSTWTVPAGVTNAKVTVVGGGGGGSTAGGSYGNGGGGGAGGTAISYLALTPGASISYTVGAGGAPAAAGTNSTFGPVSSVTLQGSGGGAGVNGNGSDGGAGGTATGGTLNIPGGRGQAGNWSSGYSYGSPGSGGASSIGPGAAAPSGLNANSNYPASAAYGGGGAGASAAGLTQSSGATGVILIEY